MVVAADLLKSRDVARCSVGSHVSRSCENGSRGHYDVRTNNGNAAGGNRVESR
jgi:hypothetical protein